MLADFLFFVQLTIWCGGTMPSFMWNKEKYVFEGSIEWRVKTDGKLMEPFMCAQLK